MSAALRYLSSVVWMLAAILSLLAYGFKGPWREDLALCLICIVLAEMAEKDSRD